MVTEKNIEEFDELMKAIGVGVSESIEIYKDKKISGGEVIGLILKAPVFIKGIAGAEQVVPVLMATDEQTVSTRTQIIRDRFNLPSGSEVIEMAIENWLASAIAFGMATKQIVVIAKS